MTAALHGASGSGLTGVLVEVDSGAVRLIGFLK
jgi:hypothetical protein